MIVRHSEPLEALSRLDRKLAGTAAVNLAAERRGGKPTLRDIGRIALDWTTDIEDLEEDYTDVLEYLHRYATYTYGRLETP